MEWRTDLGQTGIGRALIDRVANGCNAPYLGHRSHPGRPPKAVKAGVNATGSLRREHFSP